jgi:serine/threonine protein kinase
VVKCLEDQGIPHRDIKPDNVAVGMVGRGDPLHLVLIDFSLSRTPPENVEAGTKAYLDPFLTLRTRWDLYAERYAAVTLFEMTTGMLPVWGDGGSEPSQLDCARPLLMRTCSTRPCGRGWCPSSPSPSGGTPPSDWTTPR